VTPSVAAAAAEPLPSRRTVSDEGDCRRVAGLDLLDEPALAARANDVVVLLDVNKARAAVAPIRRGVGAHVFAVLTREKLREEINFELPIERVAYHLLLKTHTNASLLMPNTTCAGKFTLISIFSFSYFILLLHF